MTDDEYNDAIEKAALACVRWGEGRVEHWLRIGDPSMVEDAKARAWDALMCAHAVRQLKRKTLPEDLRNYLDAVQS